MDPFCTNAATALHEVLKTNRHRIVFAESCTGGLAAASLSRLPGISAWLVGSMVVYQNAAKICWLNVSEDLLAEQGAVCRPVAEQMASGALRFTPHATVAAAVTGHLGPNAPRKQDGIVWAAVAVRHASSCHLSARQLSVEQHANFSKTQSLQLRHHRQTTAVHQLLTFCRTVLNTPGQPAPSASNGTE